MENILKKYIEDGNSNGLYLLPFPTGFGKSYEAVQYIAKKYSSLKENQHIFFITSNLNNLPVQDMMNALGEEKMNRECIVIKSYRDCILDNFDISEIPEEFVDDDAIKLDNALRKYLKAKSQYEDEHDKENFITRAPEIVKNEAKKLDECEKNFRSYIYTVVAKRIRETLPKEDNKGVRYSNAHLQEQVYDILKKDSRYTWIGRIYPNIFVKDYKIIFMSVKKFLTSNNPFYEPRYTYINGQISENAIVFIDEFDGTKDTINDSIIEQALQNASDYISLVEKICSRIISYERYLPTIVINVLKEYSEEFEKLFREANNIYEKYKLNLKYHCAEVTGRNFLFNDFTYHSILNSLDKKYVYVRENSQKNNMSICLADKYDRTEKNSESTASYNLYTIIRTMNRFLMDFKQFVLKASKTYKYLKDGEAGPSVDVLSEENAVLSFLEVFGLTYEESIFIKSGYNYKTSYKLKTPDKAVRRNGYYDRGLKTYEFTNKASRSESTAFSVIDISETAESLIAELSKKAKVVGISATANIDSVLCNYSLKYLKKSLGTDFHTIDQEDFNEIKNKYRYQNRKYLYPDNPDGQIKPLIHYVDYELEQDGMDTLQMIKTVFKDARNVRKVNKKLIQYCNNEKFIKRYLSIAYVFREFICDDNIRSFLCLNNALPKPGSNLDTNVIRELFEILIRENNVKINDDYFVVLRSGSSFEYNKQSILERLSNGDKIFLISAYATLGAGQNLPYYPAENDRLINLNDEINLNDPRNRKKDFDAIYLGEITNITTNIYSDSGSFSSEDLYQYISQMENLYENDEISYFELNRAIKDGFLKLQKPSLKLENIPGKRPYRSKTGYITKQTIQAIGRLNRTFNKRENIHIYISSSIYYNFDDEINQKEIVSPEVEALIDYVIRKRGAIPYNEYNLEAEHISYATKNHIYETLSGSWSWEDVEYWKRLREVVLKHPTAGENTYNKDIIFSENFIHNNDSSDFNKYFFFEAHDFSMINIAFNETKDEASLTLKKARDNFKDGLIKECSYENSRLEQILRYPGMKEFFKNNGYATAFKKNKYMMCPTLYQNIYKGALGEVAGKFILEEELKISLQELNDEYFEMFDYVLTDGIYIDFKHWRKSPVDTQKYLDKISNKLNDINGRKVYIINIFDESGTENQITETYSGRVVEVPYLLESETFKANREIIGMLKGDLMNDE